MVNYTTRKVTSLNELKPGDHIRVPGSKDTKSSSGFASISSGASYVSAGAASDIAAHVVNYQPCDNKHIRHHLLVVKWIDNTRVQVIHKVTDGVKEEILRYRSYDVTVLDYRSRYMGEQAVKRAREIMRQQQEYKLLSNNCEHFVTLVRTGEKESEQIQGAVAGGVAVGGGGATLGGAAGAGTGALIGAGIGSVVPVAGTIVGAGIGAIIGGIAGAVGGGAGGAAGGAALGTKIANTD